MSKFLSLLKATMSGGLELFSYHGKTKQTQRTVPILLAILMSIAMLIGAIVFVSSFIEEGIDTVIILPLYMMATVIIILTEGINKSSDLLFKPHDNDTLLAMPLKKSTIILVRIIKFYIFELLYCLIFLLPAIIAYAVSTEVTASYPLVALIVLLLTPIIPIVLSCLAGLFISAISTKFKHTSLLQTILSLAIVLASALILLATNTLSGTEGSSVLSISNTITEYYYPASAFVSLVADFNFVQLTIFVLVNSILLAATIFLISHYYFKIISRIAIIKHTERINQKYNFSRHSQTFAIIKKELIKYFSTPVLIVNTATGLALFLIAVGALCFKYDDIVAAITASVEDFPLTPDELRTYLPTVTFIMIAFASLMTFIAATMISLEGKAYNTLKTMPVSGVKVIMSKVLAATILIVPLTIAGGITMSIRFEFGIINTILILVAAIVMTLVTELIGILVNLKYARFDSENDAVAVRQSASILVATFSGLGMFLLTISFTTAAVFLAGQTVGLVMIDAAFVVIAVYLCIAVATRGEEKYTKLSA